MRRYGRRTILALPAAAISLFVSAAPAFADLKLCNRMSYVVEAAIEALAGSIAAKGMLQNLVVEPEVDADGAETGFYLVTVGEGRWLAQYLCDKL